MSDLIERQAAKEALQNAIDEVNHELWELEGSMGYCEMVSSIGNALDGVPSAQPEKAQLSREDTTSDCISRQAAKEHFYMYAPGIAWAKIDEILDNIPSAQLEQKKGIWKRWHETLEDASGVTYITRCQCSECGTEYDPHSAKFINFCPQCGADMRGDNNE